MAGSVVVVGHAAQATGIGQFSFRGRTADPFAEPELLTVAVAFERFAGIDLLSTVRDGEGDRDVLAAAAKGRGGRSGGGTPSANFSQNLGGTNGPKLWQGRF